MTSGAREAGLSQKGRIPLCDKQDRFSRRLPRKDKSGVRLTIPSFLEQFYKIKGIRPRLQS